MMLIRIVFQPFIVSATLMSLLNVTLAAPGSKVSSRWSSDGGNVPRSLVNRALVPPEVTFILKAARTGDLSHRSVLRRSPDKCEGVAIWRAEDIHAVAPYPILTVRRQTSSECVGFREDFGEGIRVAPRMRMVYTDYLHAPRHKYAPTTSSADGAVLVRRGERIRAVLRLIDEPLVFQPNRLGRLVHARYSSCTGLYRTTKRGSRTNHRFIVRIQIRPRRTVRGYLYRGGQGTCAIRLVALVNRRWRAAVVVHSSAQRGFSPPLRQP